MATSRNGRMPAVALDPVVKEYKIKHAHVLTQLLQMVIKTVLECDFDWFPVTFRRVQVGKFALDSCFDYTICFKTNLQKYLINLSKL